MNDGKGNVHSLSYSFSSSNMSLFRATFCYGEVEVSVLADSGPDCTMLSSEVLEKVINSKPNTIVQKLDKEVNVHCASMVADPIRCTRQVTTDVELIVRHGEKLVLRGVK